MSTRPVGFVVHLVPGVLEPGAAIFLETPITLILLGGLVSGVSWKK
jgi:hypothetical protein